MNGAGDSDVLTLLPSNWYYNASVIGFLKVLEHAGVSVENYLRDDGTVEIDRSVFATENGDDRPKALEWYYHYHEVYVNPILNKPLGLKIVGNSLYTNFINPSSKTKDEHNLSLLVQYLSGDSFKTGVSEPCNLCCQSFSIIPDKDANQDFGDFLKNRSKLNMMHGSYIGGSFDFPNAFWNMKTSVKLCPLCIYLVLHHHLPFIRTTSGELFINAPSFKIMWYINKIATEMMSRQPDMAGREILGLSYLGLAQRIYSLLGTWSLMNIEMVIKKDGDISYFSLPLHISRVLNQKGIAALIHEAGEPLVFKMILNGDFDDLIKLSHSLCKLLFAFNDISEGKPTDEMNNIISNDSYLKRLDKITKKDITALRKLAIKLPLIYARIRQVITQEYI
ncbi:MAG: hypothetical protein HQL61_08230 [Magnetococcales bacterium]|nr:hypothetical protein [Nitrospirota bacterium]